MSLVEPIKTCEYCKAVVRVADYAGHLAVTHRLKTVPGAQPIPTLPPVKVKRPRGGGEYGGNGGANWWSGGA